MTIGGLETGLPEHPALLRLPSLALALQHGPQRRPGREAKPLLDWSRTTSFTAVPAYAWSNRAQGSHDGLDRRGRERVSQNEMACAKRRMRMKHLFQLLAVTALSVQAASAQFQEWQHRVPFTSSPHRKGRICQPRLGTRLPLLVRLNKDFFDFSQARPTAKTSALPRGQTLGEPGGGVGCRERRRQHLGARPRHQRKRAARNSPPLGNADAASESSGAACSMSPTAT